MSRIGVFVGISLMLFLGLLGLLVALAVIEGEGLISCRDCSDDARLLGPISPWRVTLAVVVAVTGGVIAARRHG